MKVFYHFPLVLIHNKILTFDNILLSTASIVKSIVWDLLSGVSIIPSGWDDSNLEIVGGVSLLIVIDRSLVVCNPALSVTWTWYVSCWDPTL